LEKEVENDDGTIRSINFKDEIHPKSPFGVYGLPEGAAVVRGN